MQPCGAGLSRPLCAQGPQPKQEAEKLDPEPQLLYRRLLIQTSGETLIQPEFHLGNPHCSHVPGAVVLLEIRVWWDGEALPGLGGWCALELTHTELHRVGLVLPWMCHCSRSPASGWTHIQQ